MPVEPFNASVYLLDRQVEAGRGGHLAVTGPAGSLTYAELAERVAAFASGLQALGVRPEERVVLVASDRPETVITFLALLRMGAVAVPVSTMYNGAELAELLRDTRARVVVVPPRSARVVVVPARAAVPPWAAIPASGSPVPIVAIAPIPVISPAGVPELSWAPLGEGAGLSLRLGCGARSG